MSFAEDVARFAAKVEQRSRDIHNGCADLAFSSIVEGSPVTGAPGQPVDTGYLKGSWQNLIDGPLSRRIVTNAAYAPVIEENNRAAYDPRGTVGSYGVEGGKIGPALPTDVGNYGVKGGDIGPALFPKGTTRKSRKSTVGGHYSVRLTVDAWDRIVRTVTREVVRDD